jgi:hypothetical protein
VNLLCADGVHLFSNNVLHLAQHSPSKGKPGVTAWCRTADIPRTNEEAMRGDLGIRGVISKGADEEVRETKHRSETLVWMAIIRAVL